MVPGRCNRMGREIFRLARSETSMTSWSTTVRSTSRKRSGKPRSWPCSSNAMRLYNRARRGTLTFDHNKAVMRCSGHVSKPCGIGVLAQDPAWAKAERLPLYHAQARETSPHDGRDGFSTL